MFLNALGLASALLAPDPRSTEAETALRRSLERHSSMNVDAIVEKPFRGGDTLRIRMQYDASGRRRTEVLSPMVVQGRVFIDDGVTWTTYNPDTKVLRVHPAPPDEDLGARMWLVHRNYRVEIGGRTSVAGRSALLVVATPLSGDLRTQRFYLDAATSTPLKAESVDSLGNVTVQFTVRRIGFPSKLAKEAFATPEAPGARHESGHAPVPVGSPDEAARKVGFRPAMPKRFPYGFRAQGLNLMNRGGQTPVATLLTDGLVRVYVYQSRSGNAAPPGPPSEEVKVAQDVNGVHIEVRGDDVPATARERILQCFVRWFQHDSRH